MMVKWSSSGLVSSISWWKFLWWLNVPSKVKLFIWRACHNWIPSLVNLAKRGVGGDVLCPVCYRQAETSLHALWTCTALKKLRSMCPFMQAIMFHDGLPFGDFIRACVDHLSSYELDLLYVVL
ncbi:hypothetical protein Ddye_000796 [Dipteronia dyeriana]|uniref:Reverse transcriptase zinc-binding domain-containing protein n=1 Tax=Dipteronia dyeriana TaxID=168575 RepID=A0AAD9XN46_9ROSI|nr:hypothetical protein Ddye_000796 [Dipteronia dyeriana]